MMKLTNFLVCLALCELHMAARLHLQNADVIGKQASENNKQELPPTESKGLATQLKEKAKKVKAKAVPKKKMVDPHRKPSVLHAPDVLERDPEQEHDQDVDDSDVMLDDIDVLFEKLEKRTGVNYGISGKGGKGNIGASFSELDHDGSVSTQHSNWNSWNASSFFPTAAIKKAAAGLYDVGKKVLPSKVMCAVDLAVSLTKLAWAVKDIAVAFVTGNESFSAFKTVVTDLNAYIKENALDDVLSAVSRGRDQVKNHPTSITGTMMTAAKTVPGRIIPIALKAIESFNGIFSATKVMDRIDRILSVLDACCSSLLGFKMDWLADALKVVTIANAQMLKSLNGTRVLKQQVDSGTISNEKFVDELGQLWSEVQQSIKDGQAGVSKDSVNAGDSSKQLDSVSKQSKCKKQK